MFLGKFIEHADQVVRLNGTCHFRDTRRSRHDAFRGGRAVAVDEPLRFLQRELFGDMTGDIGIKVHLRIFQQRKRHGNADTGKEGFQGDFLEAGFIVGLGPGLGYDLRLDALHQPGQVQRRAGHLYLSTYFETHRSDYYRRLQGVRERGDIDAWLLFFLEAVREQAGDAITRSQRLVRVRESYFGEAIQARSSLPRLVAMLVENPFVTVRSVESRLGLTNQGARTLIRSAVSRGWLVSLGRRGRGSREYWYSPRVFDVMNAPMAYDRSEAPDHLDSGSRWGH